MFSNKTIKIILPEIWMSFYMYKTKMIKYPKLPIQKNLNQFKTEKSKIILKKTKRVNYPKKGNFILFLGNKIHVIKWFSTLLEKW
jgi:hypothetical protein